MSSRQLRRFVTVTALGAIAATASAEGPIPYQSGRFLSADREVSRGAFSDSLRIDAITLGHATYRAQRNELVVPSSVRVSIDRDGDGVFEMLSDEELRSGQAPVGFALGRGVNSADVSTSLEVASALDLARLLYSDGTARVRVDILLSVPLYDDREGETDQYPEALLAGAVGDARMDLYAIVGGNIDEPILAPRHVALAGDDVARGRTGVSMLTQRSDAPYAIGMVGVDLSTGFGVEPGLRTIGYRLEVEPGAETAFAVFGAGTAMQLAEADEELLEEEEPAGASAGSLGGGGGGGFGSFGGSDLALRAAWNPHRTRRPVAFRGTRSPVDNGFDLSDLLRDLRDRDTTNENADRDRRRNRNRDGGVNEDDGTTNDGDAGNEGDGTFEGGGGPGEEENNLRDRVKRSGDDGPEGRDDDPTRRERRDNGGVVELFDSAEESPFDQRKTLADPDSITRQFEAEGRESARDGLRNHGVGHQPVPGPGALPLLVIAGLSARSRRR